METISAIGAAPKRPLVLAPAKKPSSAPRFHTTDTAHRRPASSLDNTLISYGLFTRPLPILPVFMDKQKPEAFIILTGVHHLHGHGLTLELKPSSSKASLAYFGEAGCTLSFDILYPPSTRPPSFSSGLVSVTFENLRLNVEDFPSKPLTSGTRTPQLPSWPQMPPPTYSTAKVQRVSIKPGNDTLKRADPAASPISMPDPSASMSFLVDFMNKRVKRYIPLATAPAGRLTQDPSVQSFLANRTAYKEQHQNNAAPRLRPEPVEEALRAFFDGSLEDSGRISHKRGVVRNSEAYSPRSPLNAHKLFFPSRANYVRGPSTFLRPVYDNAIKFLRLPYKDDEDTPDDASFLQSFEEGLARAEFPDALSFNVGESVMSGGLASVKFEGLEVKSYTTEHEKVYFNTRDDHMWIHVPGVKLSFKGHGVAAKAEFEFNGEIEETLVLTAVVRLDPTTLEPSLVLVTYGEDKHITGEIVSKSMLGAVLVKPANAMLQSRLKTSEFQEAFRKAFKNQVFEEAKELGITKPIRMAIKSIVRGYTELYVQTNNAKVHGLHRNHPKPN